MRKEFSLIISKIENRRKLYFGVAAALISAGIAAVIPYIYGRLVDIAIAPNSQIKIILGLIFLWLVLSLIADLISRFVDKSAYEISVDLTNELLVDLFNHLLLLPLQFHKEHKMAKVRKRAERGIDDLYHFIEETIFHFLPTMISFLSLYSFFYL